MQLTACMNANSFMATKNVNSKQKSITFLVVFNVQDFENNVNAAANKKRKIIQLFS